jgi:hypothetical protein
MDDQPVNAQDAATDEVPVDFEAWTALSALFLDTTMDARIEILDEQHIEPEDWERSDEHHLRALAADLAAGRMARAERYAAACAAEIERRKTLPAAPADETPVEAPAEPVPPAQPVPPAVVEPAAAPMEPPTLEMATFLKPGHEVAAPVQAAPPPPQAAPPPQVTRERVSLTGTATGYDVPLGLREAAAKLPFAAAPPAPPQPSYVAGGSTPRAPAEAAATPSVPARVTNLGSTLPVGAGSLQQRTALPFAQPPAPGGAAPAFPGMALQTYASLRAELMVAPERAAEILAKYQIAGDAAWHALDQEWQARLAKLPETRATFEQLLSSYKEWLRRQPR